MCKKKFRILHIVNDEKFIKDAFDIFSKSSNDYHHQLALVGKKKKLRYLRNMNVIFINPISLLPFLKVTTLAKYDIFIFHGLKGFKFNLLKKINKNSPILWIGYGFDYYHLINPIRKDFLLKKTRHISVHKKKGSIKSKRFFFNMFQPSLNTKLSLLSRVNYFNPVVREEHYIFRKVLGDLIPEFIDWNYPIITKNLMDNLPELNAAKGNILIGNSNANTNNHLDAFELLSLYKIKGINEIVCPLSYGGHEAYKKEIVEAGKKIFGSKFIPLIDFLKPEEYFKLLSGCTFYFSPTLRQQAFGNILMMLYLGASVILYEENPIYSFLKKSGFIIFSEKNIMDRNLRELSTSEIELNKELVMNNYSEESLIMKTRGLLELLANSGENL